MLTHQIWIHATVLEKETTQDKDQMANELV